MNDLGTGHYCSVHDIYFVQFICKSRRIQVWVSVLNFHHQIALRNRIAFPDEHPLDLAGDWGRDDRLHLRQESLARYWRRCRTRLHSRQHADRVTSFHVLSLLHSDLNDHSRLKYF